MNGNQVLNLLKQRGFEKGATEVLLRLAEEHEDMKRGFKEMAQAFDALTRVQTMLNGVADGMNDKLKKLDRPDDDPSSTRGMLK